MSRVPTQHGVVASDSERSIFPLSELASRQAVGVWTCNSRRRAAVDWNRVEGSWKQMKGKIKEKWGKLTDDDLNVIDGKQDQLEGKIQERYGYAKDQARREIDDWYNAQSW